MARIRPIPSTTSLYTNAPDAILILARRGTEPVPYLSEPLTELPNADCQTAVSRMRDDMGSNGTIIAYFDSITWRRYMASISDLEKIVPVRGVWTSEDGGLYGLDGGSPATSLITGQ